MERKAEFYSIVVNGNVAAMEVPADKILPALKKYGVGREQTVFTLLRGKEQRVYGQDIRLIASDSLGVIEPSAEQKPMPEAEPVQEANPQLSQYTFILGDLKQRASRFHSRAVTSGIVAGVAAFLGGMLYVVGVTIEPTVGINNIAIPPEVAQVFSENETSAYKFETAPLAVVNMIFNTMQPFVVALAMISLGFSAITARWQHFGSSVLILMGVLVTPILLDEIIPSTQSPEADQFFELVEAQDLTKLEGYIASRADVNDKDSTYLLAQVAIAQGVSSPSIGKAAQHLRAGEFTFEVEPRIAYAIESAAHGAGSSALSESSKEYAQSSSATAERLKYVGVLALVAGALAGLYSAVKGLMSLTIRRRLDRISDILTRH